MWQTKLALHQLSSICAALTAIYCFISYHCAIAI